MWHGRLVHAFAAQAACAASAWARRPCHELVDALQKHSRLVGRPCAQRAKTTKSSLRKNIFLTSAAPTQFSTWRAALLGIQTRNTAGIYRRAGFDPTLVEPVVDVLWQVN